MHGQVRSLPDPGFAGDDGAVAPAVAAALAAYDSDPDASHSAALAVVQRSRLLVPVVALLGEVGTDQRGLAVDKSSDMATVLMRGRDGRMALLAFTGLEPLQRWQPDARPVPVAAPDAARAALADDAQALVIDVAGPVRFIIEAAELQALADGFVLTEVAGAHAWLGMR